MSHSDRTTPTPEPGAAPRALRVAALALAPLLVLAALLLPTSAAQAAAPQAAASPAAGTGWIRAGHLAAGEGAADVWLTPFSGGDAVSVRDVAYGDVTPFRSVPTGLYTVAVLPAGAPMSAAPMVSASVRVQQDQATSVFAIGEKGDVRSQVVQDDLTAPPAGQARVRLLAAAGADESVGARLSDGTELAQDVPEGQSTGYATVAAQTWSVEVTTTSGATTTARVPVQAGGVYTLIAAQGPDGSGVRLEAVQDASGSSRMPRGGVDTGGGYLAGSTAGAAEGSESRGAALGAATAGMLAMVALIGLGRRREAEVER